MKITIDNLDGLGAVDYTPFMTGAAPLTIERKLNEPSSCTIELAVSSLRTPASGGRVLLTADNGTLLFSGYVIATPAHVYAGLGTTGPLYTVTVDCLSDEFTLDARVSGRTLESVAMTAGELLAKITGRAGSSELPTTGDGTSLTVGTFQALAGKSWAENVGALANAARASYRVAEDVLQFASVGDVVHTLSESDGSLDRSALRLSRSRAAVSDITVCGKVEPQAYVTEIFEGDGITSVFDLSEPPREDRAALLFDTFSGAAIDAATWSLVDSGGRVSLTARGLTVGSNANSGADCSVAAVDAVEMGGVLLMELSGLAVDGPGEGHLAALSANGLDVASFVAGFHARVSGASSVLTPMVLGVEAGASYTLQTGHTYTLRLRFHCRDHQRALQSYSAGGANGTLRAGAQLLSAGADVVMEVQETTGGAFFPSVVLFDGTVEQVPQSCTPLVIDGSSFVGSIAGFELTRPGDVWVSCVAAGATAAATTQRLGLPAQSAQAKVSSTGRLSFYPGNIPAVGTTIRILYRLGGYAVARMMSSTSASAGSLIVTVEHPETRSSADCENAALVLLSTSTWNDGAWEGSYTCWNPQKQKDIWPGDLLQVDAPSAAVSTGLLVRAVRVEATACAPEVLKYTVGFANEWAEALSVKTRPGAPTRAWLPPVALASSTALPCLRDLAINSVSKTQVEVQAGLSPPVGGGFEVRRSDWKFGAGDGADLVLRSPTPGFTIVREGPVERYYVRMYDGAMPPNYSRFSSALFISASMQ